MAAPFFDSTRSLQAHREDLVHLHTRLHCNPDTRELAAPIKKLIEDWPTVYYAQLEHWDAQSRAQIRVEMTDEALDEHVDEFAPLVLDAAGGDRSSAHYRMYFAMAPSELKRFVLGEELDVIRGWVTMLSSEASAALRKHGTRFASEVANADEAVAERAIADAKNNAFRATGSYATYVERVREARDHAWLELERIRATDKTEKRPREWTNRFFAALAPEASTTERKARAAERAKEREERDAAAERRKVLAATLKKAQGDLRAHDKSASGRGRAKTAGGGNG
jgi:hypothetical protein